MRVVFMGTPDFAARALESIIGSRHRVVLAVTQPDKAKDRGKKVQPTPVKEVASNHEITVLQPERVKGNAEFIGELAECRPDVIVVAAYGKLLPKEVLELPKYGCINIHASLLPKLRGASPIQSAIVGGERETGVTVMQMAEGMDTGDMLMKRAVAVGDMNFSQLHDALAQIGAELILEALDAIEAGTVTPRPQNHGEATYSVKLRKEDGHLDFSKSPEEAVRLIRGFDPWPGAFCSYEDETTAGPMVIKFWSAMVPGEAASSPNGCIESVSREGIRISCGGGILLVSEIQVPGKKRVKVSDFIQGNSLKKNVVLR